MSLLQKIDADLKQAMISKNALKLDVLRFLKSAVKYAAIEKKVENLNDAETQAVIQKQIKQRRESIDQFVKGGRADLAEKEKNELAVLEAYMPAQIPDAELEKLVAEEAKTAGAVSKKDFGRMMKLLTEKLAGRTDARRISDCLGKILS